MLNNTVDAILSETKNKPKEQENWMKKKDYGQTPEYLNEIKEALRELNEEKRQAHIRRESENQSNTFMSEEERNEIREGLKEKYMEVSQEYQKITHKVVNSLNLKEKK